MIKLFVKNRRLETIELNFKTYRGGLCALIRREPKVLDDAGRVHEDIVPAFGSATTRVVMEKRGYDYLEKAQALREEWSSFVQRRTPSDSIGYDAALEEE